MFCKCTFDSECSTEGNAIPKVPHPPLMSRICFSEFFLRFLSLLFLATSKPFSLCQEVKSENKSFSHLKGWRVNSFFGYGNHKMGPEDLLEMNHLFEATQELRRIVLLQLLNSKFAWGTTTK